MAMRNKNLSQLAFLLFNFMCLSYAQKRDVKTTTWPDCAQYKDSCATAKALGRNVVYSKASLPTNDNLLYAFSTIGVPSVVIAHTVDGDMDMAFNWDLLVNSTSLTDAITFKSTSGIQGNVDYKYGMAFTKLIEFNDQDDTADMAECQKNHGNGDFNIRSFTEFVWHPLPELVSDNTFTFNASINASGIFPYANQSQSISLKFTVRGQEGREVAPPSLKFLANETQIELEIDGIAASFNSSRWGVEVAAVSPTPGKDMTIKTTHSIDDEYSPGVFKINDLLTQASFLTGFVQWKPVAYFDRVRGRGFATEVKHYPLNDCNDTAELGGSILYAIFQGDLWREDKVTKTMTNISFGLPKDGFYMKNNYTEWSLAVGYGSAPKDAISSTVVIIISAGLGLPVLIMILGAIWQCRKRCSNPDTAGYAPIGGEQRIN